jgi:hypothetical protein
MEWIYGSFSLFLLASMVLAFKSGRIRDLAEELQNIFRGGPPPPMHPSPADDSALLGRRRGKSTEQ